MHRRVVPLLVLVLGGLTALAHTQTLIRQFGGTGTGSGQFREINGISFDDSGNLYVLDAGNSRVQVFDPNGAFLRTFGSFGTGPGQFEEPCGITVSSFWRRIFVSEGLAGTTHHRIQYFGLDGSFEGEFGTQGSGDGQLDSPCQMAAFGAGGSLFVADAGNSRVQEFTVDGRFRAVIGARGSGDGEFNRPMGLVGLSSDRILGGGERVYVSDAFAGRVQAFDGSGNFLFDFGITGTGEGEFDRPCHMSAFGNELGLIYVADARNQRIQVFDRDGVFHAQIASLGVTGPSQSCANTPLAVGTDPLRGLIYVEENDFIKVFTIDRDGDGLLDVWETDGLDADNDGVVDLDLPNIAGPGIGTDPDHKDLFLELDWESGSEPNQAAVQAMKTAFAFAPVDAGGIPNPDGQPGINLWVDTGGLDVSQVSEDGAGPGSCSDGIDNDGEGPFGAGTCSDGIDNDLNGFADAADPTCNGGDALDPRCSSIEDGTFVGSCFDGVDNGGDGLGDLGDPDCLVGDDLRRESGASAGSCRDGMDNDGDGRTDAADLDCVTGGNALFNPVANESGGAPDMSCSDGTDNDGDGSVDGQDANCVFTQVIGGINSRLYLMKHGSEALPVEDGGGPNSCFDGIDNGSVGGADMDDRDCTSTCFDGIDNDGDGLTDAQDANCAAGGNFDRAVRKLVFRYAISVSGGGGQGEFAGNDFVTANSGDGGTMMHELGHNLSLRHGGGEPINRKPNYISVMDYDEQFCIFARASTAGCGTADFRRLLDFSPARYGGSEGTFTAASVCYDAIDNDLDGLIDAADPECHLDLSRGVAPLTPLVENAIDESFAFDITNTGHSVVFHDANGVVRLWNADGDVDGDGTRDGVDWLGDGAPFDGTVLTVDSNRDSICVCAGADLTLESMADGDDVPFAAGIPGCPGLGPSIRNGPNQTCESTAAATDAQVRTEGRGGAGSCTDGTDNDRDGATDEFDEDCFEPMFLRGFDDWSNIVMDFKGFDDSPSSGNADAVIEDPIDLDDFEQQLRLLNRGDLAIDLTASPVPVESGDDLTIELTLQNNGPNPTSSALARSVADPATVVVTAPPECVGAGATELACDVGVLGIGETVTFDVTVTTGQCVDGVPSPITHRASVENLAGEDPNPTNDAADLTLMPIDTTPPMIESLGATPSVLWPPNHKMVPVTLNAVATDTCTAAPSCRITDVASNEPVTGKGSGKTTPDWLITGDLNVDLRAERSGKGSGRIYMVTVECSDASSNSSSGTVQIMVPHNQ